MPLHPHVAALVSTGRGKGASPEDAPWEPASGIHFPVLLTSWGKSCHTEWGAGDLRTPAKERHPVSPRLGQGIWWTIRQMQGGTVDHVKSWLHGFDGYQLISIHLCDFNYKVCSLQLSVVSVCVCMLVRVCMRCVCILVCVCMWCMYGCMGERMEITALLSIEICSIPEVLYFRCWGGVAGNCTVFTGPRYSFTLA